MTLKQMEVFLAVADTSSFSKGGELVSLAQSTASQHIRSLEEELGTRLFDRSASQVALTEAGRLFYEHVKSICNSCDEARHSLRKFMNLEKAILKIGASSVPASCVIPDMLGVFSKRLPGVRLEVFQGDTRSVTRALLDEEVEVAVVGGQFDSGLVRFDSIGSEKIILVTLPGEYNKNSVLIDELRGLPMVIREEGSGTRQSVDAAILKSGIDPKEIMVSAQLGSSEAVRRAILSGAGWAFISSLAVKSELEDGRLKAVSVAGLEIERQFYLAKRSERTLSPAATVFVNMLLNSGGNS